MPADARSVANTLFHSTFRTTGAGIGAGRIVAPGLTRARCTLRAPVCARPRACCSRVRVCSTVFFTPTPTAPCTCFCLTHCRAMPERVPCVPVAVPVACVARAPGCPRAVRASLVSGLHRARVLCVYLVAPVSLGVAVAPRAYHTTRVYALARGRVWWFRGRWCPVKAPYGVKE